MGAASTTTHLRSSSTRRGVQHPKPVNSLKGVSSRIRDTRPRQLPDLRPGLRRPRTPSHDEGGQYRPTAPNVVGYLQEQVLDGVELLRRPKSLDELHDDCLAVEIEIGAIQDVGLDPAVGAREGRVGADRD